MAYPTVKFGTNDLGRLSRLGRVATEKSGTTTYRKYRMRLHLRQTPLTPVCDVHVTFLNKPNLWESVNTDNSPATPGTANQVRMGTMWPGGWSSSYNVTTGRLDFVATECPPGLDQTMYLFSFWTDKELGRVTVQLTDGTGGVVGPPGTGELD